MQQPTPPGQITSSLHSLAWVAANPTHVGPVIQSKTGSVIRRAIARSTRLNGEARPAQATLTFAAVRVGCAAAVARAPTEDAELRRGFSVELGHEYEQAVDGASLVGGRHTEVPRVNASPELGDSLTVDQVDRVVAEDQIVRVCLDAIRVKHLSPKARRVCFH